jgi:hypothetical protein
MTNGASATRAGKTAKTATQWRFRLTVGHVDTKQTFDRAQEGLACLSWGELGVTRSMRQRQVASARYEAPFGRAVPIGRRKRMGLRYGHDGPGLHFKPGGT